MLSSLSWCQCFKPSLLFLGDAVTKQARELSTGKVCQTLESFSFNVLKRGGLCHLTQLLHLIE
jgi:hypothetical protein